MKVIPQDFGTEAWDIGQGAAWAALCRFMIAQPEAWVAFEKETGLKITVPKSPIDAMIDEATGRQAALVAAWADWVTVNFWGVEDRV